MNLTKRFPTLKTLGVAAEYFPCYINREVNLHPLDVVLLSFILRGRGRHYLEEEYWPERGPSLSVTHYGQRHAIVTDRRGMEIINVYLDLQNHPLPALPAGLQSYLPLFLPLHPRFQNRLNRVVHLPLSEAESPAHFLFELIAETQKRRPGYEQAARTLFQLFLIHCCRQVERQGISLPPAPQPRLEELRQYLDAHYAHPHTLSTLARRAKMEPTSLCRAFKAYTGKRVFDYLIERRIQAAMIALRGSDAKVLAIAHASGFNDLTHFNRAFKRIVGCTPTAYRAQFFAR
jgi:AraC-like DNA-binding protein